MKQSILTIICLLGTTACMTGTLDGQKLTSHREQVNMQGLYPQAGAFVTFEAYDRTSNMWSPEGSAHTDDVPVTDNAGREWFIFENMMQLPSEGRFWGPSDADGMRAVRVRARVGNVVLATFEADTDGVSNTGVLNCASSQGWDGLSIYNNCRSGFDAKVNAPCGGYGELCCTTGASCTNDNACRNDHCVVADVSNLEMLDEWPTDAARDWVSDGRGVTTDGSYWYFSTADALYKVQKNGLGSTGFVASLNGFPTGLPAGVEWGRMDFHDGRLWVAYRVSHTPTVGIAVFDTSLNYVAHASLEPLGGLVPWIAINPVDGRLYTSDGDPSELHVYDIVWTNGGALSFPLHHRLPLTDIPYPYYLAGVLGAAFSTTGNLYLATGNVEEGILWIFDAAGNMRGKQLVGFPALYNHTSGGVVIWDTDEPGAGFDQEHANRGQIHVLDLDHTTGRLDLLHFRVSL